MGKTIRVKNQKATGFTQNAMLTIAILILKRSGELIDIR